MKTSPFLLMLIGLFMFSCGSDDDGVQCNVADTSARMDFDGQTTVYRNLGYGLDLLSDGRHQLQLYYIFNNESTLTWRQLTMTTIFRATGVDKIDRLDISNSDDGMELDLAMGDFTSVIISNNSNCFEATFSGSINYEGDILTFTDGHIEYVYDEPLEDYSFGKRL